MGDVVDLFPGDDGGEALPRWNDRLRSYLEAQGDTSELRAATMPDPPWPAYENPMVGYLIDRAAEIARREDVTRALSWLAAHSWFEAVVADRSGRIE